MGKKIIIFTLVLFVISSMVFSQEGRSNGPASLIQRLTWTPESSGYVAQAVSGSFVHVVWIEGNFVHYRRNSFGGESPGSWDPIIPLSTNGEIQTVSYLRPLDIAVSGANVYVVIHWRPDNSQHPEIWFRRSTDNGTTWKAWTRLTNNAGLSIRPGLAASGQNVYLIWQDATSGNWEIYFKRSTNNGATWGGPLRLTYSAGGSYFPCIAAAGSYVFVAWQDSNPGNNEIFFKRSSNNGVNFGPIWRVTYNSGFSWSPRIACSADGQNVYIVWSDSSPGNTEIFFKRNTNYGLNAGWQSPIRICYTAGMSEYPDVDTNGGTLVNVVWQDNNPGNLEIFGKRSSSSGASFGAVSRWTNNAGDSMFPRVNSANYTVVFMDDNPGNNEIFYK